MTARAPGNGLAREATGKPDQDSIENARILIADDDPLSRRLLAGILRAQNFTNLRFAEGGVSAMEQFRDFRPDLLLLDMQMPDISGLEVCRQIRTDSELADVPIVVQTATVDRKKMGELFAGGASDFLSKPINPSELIARVRVHLERWHSLRGLRAYRERISRELDAARRMQSELLPQPAMLRQFAENVGLRIGSYNRSSSELGGDLWGLLPIDASSFGIFLADFAGHGINAALNTFRLHALIHEYRSLHDDPAELLSRLNERLTRLLPPGQFATFMYVVIDHAAGELRFASAGAPPVVLVQGRGGRARLCDASGVPLGIEEGATYRLHQRRFPAESLLLLFSDGLSEFADDAGHRIGDAGLVKAVNSCTIAFDPHQVIGHVCDTAGISGDKMLPDDTTIVCIDRRVGVARQPCRDGGLTPGRSIALQSMQPGAEG